MEIVALLEDLTGITKEEMEKRCIPVPLDGEGRVQLTADYWEEINGIRYLKRPLKVDVASWENYAEACSNLVSNLFDSKILYVFAFSTSEESTRQLRDVFSEEALCEKGYNFLLILK